MLSGRSGPGACYGPDCDHISHPANQHYRCVVCGQEHPLTEGQPLPSKDRWPLWMCRREHQARCFAAAGARFPDPPLDDDPPEYRHPDE